MKKTAALFILITLTVNSFAQIEYLKGLIFKGKDTTHCFIKKEPLKSLQYNITVKNTIESSEEISYTPDDIEGFYIESFGQFVSKEITVRLVTDIMKSTDYLAVEEETFSKEKAFINNLVSGTAFLYTFLDKESNNHYFIEKDTVFYELYEKFNFKMIEENNLTKRKLFVQKNYLGKLAFIFSDCSKVKSKIKSVRLSENSLFKITREYNICMGYESNEDINNNLIIEKSISVGIGLNNFFFNSDHDYREIFVKNIQPFNQTPTGGLNVNFIFPKMSYDFSIYTGLLYSNNKFIATYDTVKNNLFYTYDVDLNSHFIKVPILFKYTLNKYKIKPYVFAGVFINFVVKGNNNLLIETKGEYIDRIEDTYIFRYYSPEGINDAGNRKIEVGYTTGLGIKTKLFKNTSLFIESRYEGGNGISKVAGFGVTSKYYSFVTGIEF